MRSCKSSEAIHLVYVIILTIQLYTFLFLLVTGNANFRMNQTTFTFLGFTQPQTAMPIIRNSENNSKGFTSRILWYFPKPIFRRFAESELTKEEKESCEKWEENLGNFICVQYVYVCVAG